MLSFLICMATNYAMLTRSTVLSHDLILCHSTLYYVNIVIFHA